MQTECWYWLNSGRCASAFNMALDEALLEAMPRLCRPVLRFYGWEEPAASFGYFQRYGEVEKATPLRPLIRRPTGGGIVPHDHDWTYSAIFPPSHEWYFLRATASYSRIHEWILGAFRQLSIQVALAPTALKLAPGQCFAGCEKSDVMWNGRKIAGAAQRRRTDGLLIQGSVQPPLTSLERSRWEQAMNHIGQAQGIRWLTFTPGEELQCRAESLAREKYSRTDYNRRR